MTPYGDSQRFAVRFGATLAANLARATLSFLTGILVARGLGASRYGDLSFLLGSFAAIVQLTELGTSSAFYTFISQRRRSRSLVVFYLAWLSIQFTATVVVIGLLLPAAFIERIWVGHQRSIVLLACLASFLTTQAWGVVTQLAEATRKTVLIQSAAVIQAVVHLGLVAAAVYGHWLAVSTVLWLLTGEYLLLTLVLGRRLVLANVTGLPDERSDWRTIAGEFAAYCKPMVLYGWVGFLYSFADRWLLQMFGGAEQQGFFAVAQQFAGLSLILTASILKVYWKEVAEAQEHRDHQRVQQLHRSITQGLYIAGAWLCCLLIPYSREILAATVGPRYEAAWFCLAIMLLYPVHQALGQVQGTFLLASQDTSNYARMGILVMIASPPLTYLLLAPEAAPMPGLGLGAVGLSVKEVALQILAVNLQAYMIARTNGWLHDWGYQVKAVLVFLSLGWVCKWAGETLLAVSGFTASQGSLMGLGATLYIGFSIIFLFRLASLTGLTHEQIQSMLAVMTKKPNPVGA